MTFIFTALDGGFSCIDFSYLHGRSAVCGEKERRAKIRVFYSGLFVVLRLTQITRESVGMRGKERAGKDKRGVENGEC